MSLKIGDIGQEHDFFDNACFNNDFLTCAFVDYQQKSRLYLFVYGQSLSCVGYNRLANALTQ
jgi:hypothetical protein